MVDKHEFIAGLPKAELHLHIEGMSRAGVVARTLCA